MAFSFGSAAPAPAPSAGGFSFGSTGAPAPAPAFGAPAAAPAFSAPAPAPAFGAPAPAPAFGAPAAPAPAVGGFGGFGVAPAPAPAAAGGFGVFGAAPAPAPAGGGFGGFGAAPAPAAAGGFGGFGAPAPAPASGFGGFGSPAPAPVPVARGFGGGFGAPAPAPNSAPAGGAASTILPRTKYSNLPPQLKSHLDALFDAKNKTGKGLSDISGVKIDPPGMGEGTKGVEGKEQGGEEKKEDAQADSSLRDLVPILTQISLSLQQQSATLARIEQQTREECQMATKDGLWVIERVKDRQNIMSKMKGENKLGGGQGTKEGKDPNVLSLLPRSETVPPNYLWNLLGKLEKDAKYTEGNVLQLQKQMTEAIRRNTAGASGEDGGNGGFGGDPRERIQSIITNNHKQFFRLAGRVSVNNSNLQIRKKKILRGGYSNRNKAILKLQGGGGGDRLEKKLKEEMNKFRATQTQTQISQAPGAPAVGGFGAAAPAPASAAGGFVAAPAPAAGGFGGFGAPAATGSSLQSSFGATNTLSGKKKGKGKKGR